MVEKSRREAPAPNQAKPEEFGFDLNRALESVVALQSEIPEDAFTASTLGVKRAGSGVVIRESGLVLTIGYLITEAESVWLTSADGRLTPAHALAVDSETGFGLVQALDRLDLPALDLGRSSEAQPGDPVIVAAGGRRQFLRATIVGKHEFAGYWEYLLKEAIFTAPAHPFWGGAGAHRLGRQALGHRLAPRRAGGGARRTARRQHDRADRSAGADLGRSAPIRPGRQTAAAVARRLFDRERRPRSSSPAWPSTGRPPPPACAAATSFPPWALRASMAWRISIAKSGVAVPPAPKSPSKWCATNAAFGCASTRPIAAAISRGLDCIDRSAAASPSKWRGTI